jgi:hypothetical protein
MATQIRLHQNKVVFLHHIPLNNEEKKLLEMWWAFHWKKDCLNAHGCWSMSLQALTWVSEHEHMKRTESYLEYFVHVDIILREYSLTCRNFLLLTWKNILPCVHGLKNGWTLFWTLATTTIFAKKWTKKTRLKQFMLVFSK